MFEGRSVRTMFNGWILRDRRDRGESRTAILIDAELIVGSAHLVCRIVNAAPGGMRLKLDADQRLSACIGQQLLLRLANGTVVPAFLRWARDSDVGLRLSTPITIQYLLDSGASRTLLPRSGRAPVTLATEISVGRAVHRGRLLNISAGGALLSSDARLAEGTALFIHSDLVRPLGGYVRWCVRGRIGVMLNRRLPIESARAFARRFDIHEAWLDELEAIHRDHSDAWPHNTWRA